MIKKNWLVNLSVGFAKLTGWLPALLFFLPKVRLEEGAKRRLPKNCIFRERIHRGILIRDY